MVEVSNGCEGKNSSNTRGPEWEYDDRFLISVAAIQEDVSVLITAEQLTVGRRLMNNSFRILSFTVIMPVPLDCGRQQQLFSAQSKAAATQVLDGTWSGDARSHCPSGAADRKSDL